MIITKSFTCYLDYLGYFGYIAYANYAKKTGDFYSCLVFASLKTEVKMPISRKITKEVKIGKIKIGAQNAIAVQSMLNAPLNDVNANIQQALRLQNEGCQIVRVTVPTKEHANLITQLKKSIDIPVVADIHFDYKAALACAENGVDKIRINPGNIGDDDKIKQVVKACQNYNIPIRIGVNAGSLEEHILKKYGKPTPEALVESANYHIKLLNKFDFDNIVVSIKSSHVPTVIAAYEQLSAMCNYPLHIGVTEAGTFRMGLIKSAMGIGTLLMQGIGDTLRVSLTDEPEKEIKAGFDILRAAGHNVNGVEIISCPTCGRTNIDVAAIANEVETRLSHIKKPLKVAVMGCVVNGPGEAKGADIGIAGGKDCAMLFIKGKQIRMLRNNIIDELCDEINKLV